MIIWMLCQQAGAAVISIVNTLPDQNRIETTVQGDASCHDSSALEPSSDFSKSIHSHSYSDATQKVESHAGSAEKCCDVVCQCCVSGCQSVLNGGSDQNQLTAPVSPEDNYSFVVPKILSNSLFRPPIIV